VVGDAEHRQAKGRPRIVYRAAVEPDHRDGSIRDQKIDAGAQRARLVRRYLKITPGAGAGAGSPSAESRQLDALEDHLDQVGFEARITDDGLHVELSQCPFVAFQAEHPEICSVNLALAEGVLNQVGGPLSAGRLHPQPGLTGCRCTLELHRAIPDPL
jgi:predicted ArsR family transcriptional regulator